MEERNIWVGLTEVVLEYRKELRAASHNNLMPEVIASDKRQVESLEKRLAAVWKKCNLFTYPITDLDGS